MKKIVVLCVPYKQDYHAEFLKNMCDWVSLFSSKKIHSIISFPIEGEKAIKSALSKKIDNGNHEYSFCKVLSFDTCDRWRYGLTKAVEDHGKDYYFYLWSADFFFTEALTAALALLDHQHDEDLVVGTIEAKGKKDLVDQSASFPLLKLWFEQEEQEMFRQKLLRPRSELLRLSYPFLLFTLKRRWYPTEQTIHLILQCLKNNFSIKALDIGKIRDDDENRQHPNIVEQVERMELWIKYMWREHNNTWYESFGKEEYLTKSEASSKIVRSACRTLLN